MSQEFPSYLLDSKRHFYGGAVEADALLPGLGGSLYGIQQVVDGAVDRRAVSASVMAPPAARAEYSPRL